jgi:outer membrane protein assembly factor BamB
MLMVGLALALATVVGAQEFALKWAAPYSVRGAIESTPVISPDGESIYVGVTRKTSGSVVAVTAAGGPKKGPANGWGETGERVFSTGVAASPALGANGVLYVPESGARLHALNAETGVTLWVFIASSSLTSSPVIGADDTVYFGTFDGLLHAVIASTGKERWSFATESAIESSPAVASDGTIYVGSDDKKLYAVSPAGIEKWRFATGGLIYASPALATDGTVYIASADQHLYALAPEDGRKKWEMVANDQFQASPVTGADGTIYIGSVDTNFYAVNPGDGSVRWKTSVGATMGSAAAVRGDGVIVVAADDGRVRGLDPGTGNVTRLFTTGLQQLIDSSPNIARDGSIYFGGLDDGFLYKLAGNGSPLSVLASWPAFLHDAQHTGRAAPTRTGGQLANIATRARVSITDPLIAGVVVQGASEKAYLVRAAGPALEARGVSNFLPDPQLQVFSGPTVLRANDNWSEIDPVSQFRPANIASVVGAFAFPAGSNDAALVAVLPPGVYTSVVSSVDGRPGVGLVEVYDARGGDETSKVVNLSTRGLVGLNDDILIAGFVVGGSAPMRLLLRGIGPGLTQFNVAGALARPKLEIFRDATSLRTNTGWTTDGYRNDLLVAAASVAAFPLAEGSADAAVIFDAAPGPYTVQLSGVGLTTGVALVEIYVLP